MTQATIEIDDYEILSALTQLARNIDYLEPALDEIGAAVKASILLNFREQHDPYGNAWEPLSDVTIANRRRGRGLRSPKILQDTGLLNRSISHQTDAYAVEIGTDKAYANMMQFVRIASPTDKSDYPLAQNNHTETSALQLLANSGDAAASINWTLSLQYATSGGKGAFTDTRTFVTQPSATQTTTYASMGGKLAIKRGQIHCQSVYHGRFHCKHGSH